MYEATHLVQAVSGNMDFVGMYALASMLPSCVWASVDPVIVAHYIGKDPTALLRVFGPSAAVSLLTHA